MTVRSVDTLIEQLAADARPVRPLPSPLARAAATLAIVAAAGALAILLFGDWRPLLARYADRELLMAAEMAAMLATGMLAITGAFVASVPGRSQHWRWLPLPTFLLWLSLSGVGCYGEMTRTGGGGWELGHNFDCLFFILGTSIALGAPLIWRLSRAAPIDPLPVALLGGLGSAALAAFLLQFFHPFAVTFLDLGIHLVAIGLVVAAASFNRRALSPA